MRAVSRSLCCLAVLTVVMALLAPVSVGKPLIASALTTEGPCGAPAADSCADMGKPDDEAYHHLVGWGTNEIGGPVVSPSGDTSKRFQTLRGDNSVDLFVTETNIPYVLYTEVEDGFCDDSFELYVNGQGPVYVYHADPNTLNVRFVHSATVPAAGITTATVRVTYRNIATDNCGQAAVFNVELMPIYSITGRLLSSDGIPISDAVVEAMSGAETNNLRYTTTDARGFYTFTLSASGTFTVTPWPAKFTFAPDSYAYSPAWIEVTVPPSATGQNFTGMPMQYGIAVKPLRQFSLPWGNQHLDSTNLLISDYGCLITDWTMILDYFGKYNGFQPDPLTFNTWLTNHDGFNTGGNLIPTAVINYAVPNGVNISNNQFISGIDDAYIDDSLSRGKPVILKEVITLRDGSPGTHYVLAIGKIMDGGRGTYAIIDPYFNRSSLKSYSYIYTGYYRYELSPISDLSSVYFSAGSPVQLLVTDPLGRRTGVDPSTGQLFNEIPRSSYITDTLSDLSNPSGSAHEAKVFWTQGVVSGTYKMEVIGTGAGSYTLDFIGYTQSGASSRQVITSQTTVGAVTTFVIPYSPSEGLGQVSKSAIYLPIIWR